MCDIRRRPSTANALVGQLVATVLSAVSSTTEAARVAETFDAIVIGAGVVGAATAFHLAKLGRLRVCVVERGQVCTGGTAGSCAILRTHYSVPGNTALTVKSLGLFASFKEWLEDDEADSAPYGLERFAQGRHLTGGYVIGSIS